MGSNTRTRDGAHARNTPIFSLEQARTLFCRTSIDGRRRRAGALASQLHGLAEDDPQHISLSAALWKSSTAGRRVRVRARRKGLPCRLRQRPGLLLELPGADYLALPRLRLAVAGRGAFKKALIEL
jgi:hypothetical protein